MPGLMRAASAALLSLALAACAAAQASPPNSVSAPIPDVEAAVASTYPQEFAAIGERLTAMINAGASRAEVQTEIRKLTQAFRVRHAPGILQASDAAIRRYLSASAQTIQALHAANPELCARDMQASPEIPYAPIDPAAVDDRSMSLMLLTMAEGERAPVGRAIPEEAEAWALIETLAPGAMEAAGCADVAQVVEALLLSDDPRAEAARAFLAAQWARN